MDFTIHMIVRALYPTINGIHLLMLSFFDSLNGAYQHALLSIQIRDQLPLVRELEYAVGVSVTFENRHRALPLLQ